MGRQAAALAPFSPPLSALGVQGDTVVVEGPPGARGSKGEPVRAVPVLPLPSFLSLWEELEELFPAGGSSLGECIVPSLPATLQTPCSCSHPDVCLSFSSSPDPSLCFLLCRESVA